MAWFTIEENMRTSHEYIDPCWIPPRLSEEAEAEERRVTWLELLYDLVYVATIIQLGAYLSHNVSWMGVVGFGALFVPIWWSWTGLTFYANRFVVDDIWHRLLIFAQIAAVTILAVSVEAAIGERAVQFALAYVAVRVILIVLYWRAWRHIPQARPLVWRYGLGFSWAAAIYLLSVFAPNPGAIYSGRRAWPWTSGSPWRPPTGPCNRRCRRTYPT